MQPLSKDAEELLGRLWDEFKKGRRWPQRKPFTVLFHDRGTSLDEVLAGTARSIWVNGEEIRASFDALVALSEVRQLLEPVPRLLRLAAERFIENHPFMGEGEGPRITFADLQPLWPLADRALLAAAVMRESDFSALHSGGSTGPRPEDEYFRPSIGSLRYADVQRLDEVLTRHRGEGRVEVRGDPRGQHLEVLKAAFAYTESSRAWPVALPFAVENQRIGFVKHLMDDLVPEFLRQGYGETRHSLVQLTPRAVAFVDVSGEGRRLLLAAVKAIARMWRTVENGASIPLSGVAEQVGVAPDRLKPWALFLDWAPWGGCQPAPAPGDDWSFWAHEDALKNERLSSWDEYMALWHPERKHERPAAMGIAIATQPRPEIGVEGEEKGPTISPVPPTASAETSASSGAALGQEAGAPARRAAVLVADVNRDAGAVGVDLLLVVATDTEREAVLRAAQATTRGELPQRPIHGARRTYEDLGTIGGARVALVQTEMGTATVGGSLATILTAMDELSPANVIMVGIAFGVDEAKQPIGQVLVSKQVFHYEAQRVGTDKDGKKAVVARGDRATASPTLLSRLKAARSSNAKFAVEVGLLLSGDKLVDNHDYRRELTELEPEAIGGEMEGAGLYAAAADRNVGWCIVKAVCDYADGHKRENKKARQRIAADGAAAFVLGAVAAGGFALARRPSSVPRHGLARRAAVYLGAIGLGVLVLFSAWRMALAQEFPVLPVAVHNESTTNVEVITAVDAFAECEPSPTANIFSDIRYSKKLEPLASWDVETRCRTTLRTQASSPVQIAPNDTVLLNVRLFERTKSGGTVLPSSWLKRVRLSFLTSSGKTAYEATFLFAEGRATQVSASPSAAAEWRSNDSREGASQLANRVTALEASGAERSVSDSERRHMQEVLSRVSGCRIIFAAPMGDQEAIQYAHDIRQVFEAAGWGARGVTNVAGLNPVYGMKGTTSLPGGGEHECGAAAAEALRHLGLVGGITAGNTHQPDDIEVTVGARRGGSGMATRRSYGSDYGALTTDQEKLLRSILAIQTRFVARKVVIERSGEVGLYGEVPQWLNVNLARGRFPELAGDRRSEAFEELVESLPPELLRIYPEARVDNPFVVSVTDAGRRYLASR